MTIKLQWNVTSKNEAKVTMSMAYFTFATCSSC